MNTAFLAAAALGSYAMAREASGTAWQPDSSAHGGLHLTSGDWTLMGHGVLNLVYDHQSGPRGDNKLFASGMLMCMARRPVGKVSLGAVHDFKVADNLSFGVGGLFAVNFVPNGLAPLYDGNNPTGAMGFVRLKLD